MSESPRLPAIPALDEPRPTLRPIPRWVVAIGIPVMVLIAVAAVWLLLGFGIDRDRLDAIRTGGTLGVGLGGVVVLWLAVRRQRSTELDLLQKYETHVLAERIAVHNEQVAVDNRAHQQQVAEDARRDAAERRITELYTKSVEQLGSEKAPVRLGGLYALERLAQNNPSQQQTIVNVLCAYLRMPYTLPAEQLPDDASAEARAVQEQRAQERQVRLTAQRILTEHLHLGRDPDQPPDAFWSEVDLDLAGAILIGFALQGCRVNNAFFKDAHFIEDAAFDTAQFAGDASFTGARFAGDAGFMGAEFAGAAAFDTAQFAGNAGFVAAKFAASVWFDHAKFIRKASFDGAKFVRKASFDGAEFGTEGPPEVAA